MRPYLSVDSFIVMSSKVVCCLANLQCQGTYPCLSLQKTAGSHSLVVALALVDFRMSQLYSSSHFI